MKPQTLFRGAIAVFVAIIAVDLIYPPFAAASMSSGQPVMQCGRSLAWEPPRPDCTPSYADGYQFARVDFSDVLLRWLGLSLVAASVHVWQRRT